MGAIVPIIETFAAAVAGDDFPFAGRLPARTEDPIHDWAMPDLLLGPVVGLYRPHLEGAF